MEEEKDLTLFVKAGSDGLCLGDCIFCQRVFMYMTLKQLEFQVTTVDLSRKPERFKKISSAGKLPCLYHASKQEAISDATVIEDYLERQFPGPKNPSLISKNEKAKAVIMNTFAKFTRYIKNEDITKDPQLAKSLTDDLKQIDSYIRQQTTTFLDGDSMCDLDCAMLPKLYHIRVACKEFKNYEINPDYLALWRYMNAGDEMEEFQSTAYTHEEIIHGWKKHLERL